MSAVIQAKAAAQFAAYWQGRGYEKGESQIFWTTLLNEVFGIEHPAEFITFEQQVHLDHTSFIDGYIRRTHVMIEQKSIEKDLGTPIKQSDGSVLNPFQQAKRYAAELPYSQRPRWIVTCNFREFWVYDMEQPNGEPQKILLENLEKEYYRLQFLVDEKSEHLRREMEVSVKAGELVGRIYDKLIEQYADPNDPQTLRSLNMLCVRLVFCLYAEDADLFHSKTAFHDYLAPFPATKIRKALIDLFEVLDTPIQSRDKYLDPDLQPFPYVNGGLFAEQHIEIPHFTEEIKTLLLEKASADFDWSEISPTIFGAVFESTLNPDTRRSGGMHYTSIENIHKVIDPLFLDDLWAEFEIIIGQQRKQSEQRNYYQQRKQKESQPSQVSQLTKISPLKKQQLQAFQDKLASLTFFDPACGSGNFLTETFLSLRRLENEVIQHMYGDTRQIGFEGTIKVNISQFYGIEINDFACTVAKTALWIAENQMLQETSAIVGVNLNFLPLKTNAYIHEGNALRTDWAALFKGNGELSRLSEENSLNSSNSPIIHYPDYIIGNPPFVGYSLQTKEQKEDILNIYKDEKGKTYKTAGKIDYVAGWYWKAAELMLCAANSPSKLEGAGGRVPKHIKAALVSTNSITQGEQVAAIWQPLYERFGINIDFAYRTFRWDSEAEQKAHVHCVIIGFSITPTWDADGSSAKVTAGEPPASQANTAKGSASIAHLKRIFLSDNQTIQAQNINPYLMDGENVWINAISDPLCDVPKMISGGKPVEGGFLILSPEEKDELLKQSPQMQPYIRPFTSGDDFINNKSRFCLWLVDCPPNILRSSPNVMKRIEQVRDYRLASVKEATRKCADTPTLFMEVKEPKTDYIIIPRVSSERRRYVPIGYLTKETIPSDATRFIPNASVYLFGVLISNVHMAWMRAVCGRLKSDYSYGNTIVYNNFPFPTPTEEQRKRIEQTAQAILDARAKYPDASLADLYDEVTMPPDLRTAHQNNDRAVMQAYGLPIKTTESETVAHLFKLYQQEL